MVKARKRLFLSLRLRRRVKSMRPLKIISYTMFSLLLGTSLAFAQQGAPGAAVSCAPPISGVLRVTMRPQETNMWCWAASGQMVMEFLRKDVAQCIQANNRFGRSDCCQNPTPQACILGGWPELQKYGFKYRTTSDVALSWPAVRAQLAPRNAGCRGTPFAFSWHWAGGGGHMMVATGYATNAAGETFVFVNNPWPPDAGNTQTITYDTYVELSGDHTHWNDYYDIE
jgi:hypothetical protein